MSSRRMPLIAKVNKLHNMPSPIRSNPYLAFRQPTPGARIYLFCFHHAGGGASVFRQWSNSLPPEIEVCPVQLPGREDRLRDPPFTDLSSLIEALDDALSPDLEKPFALFGHSMGAIFCFELARSLCRKRGVCPLQLFVSGSRAPHLPNPEPPIHDLPRNLFLEKLKELNGIPENVLREPDMIEFFLPILRADIKLLESYVFAESAPLNCPITAFGGLEDKIVSRAELGAWSDHTRDTFKLQMFPGDHFFMRPARQPLLQAIAADLISRMDHIE